MANETFPAFILGQPAAGTVNQADTVPIIQGGMTKQATVSQMGPGAANPTGTIGTTAVNGSAPTFMRSDAAPAIPQASTSTFGAVKIDGTTITSVAGIITANGNVLAETLGITASVASPPTLTTPYNQITTAPVGASVALANPATYMSMFFVTNATSNTGLNVKPPSGAQINALGTNTAAQIGAGATVIFLFVSATQIYTVPSS